MRTKIVLKERESLISSCQIRGARGLLKISASELAELAGVTWKTVQRFEASSGIPPSRSGTLERVKAALEGAGIEFIGDPVTSPGVRLRRSEDFSK
jgi:DNA-binding transcriptional regulator YiaG